MLRTRCKSGRAEVSLWQGRIWDGNVFHYLFVRRQQAGINWQNNCDVRSVMLHASCDYAMARCFVCLLGCDGWRQGNRDGKGFVWFVTVVRLIAGWEGWHKRWQRLEAPSGCLFVGATDRGRGEMIRVCSQWSEWRCKFLLSLGSMDGCLFVSFCLYYVHKWEMNWGWGW